MKTKRSKIRLWLFLAAWVCLLAMFFLWQNHHLTVSQNTYENPKISDALNGKRIVQVSDLHNQEFGTENSKLLEQISLQRPDWIVITGDLVDCRRTDVEAALRFVRGAVELAPVYYVTGNHEQIIADADRTALQEGLEKCGAVILQNEAVAVSVGQTKLCFIGLDDANLADDTLQTITSQLPQDTLQILLAHEPQYLENYAKAGVDLVFSGHAHGGQFRLPFGNVGFIAPGQGFFPAFTAGFYVSGKTTMMVSRGLGNSIVPVRIFNQPEIVTVELTVPSTIGHEK